LCNILTQTWKIELIVIQAGQIPGKDISAMITERTLRQYRKISLNEVKGLEGAKAGTDVVIQVENFRQAHEIIIKLTQELLDQHLMRK
jgi:hypothetical protein